MTEDGSRPDGSRKRIRRDPRLKVKRAHKSKGCSLLCQDFYNALSFNIIVFAVSVETVTSCSHVVFLRVLFASNESIYGQIQNTV